MRVYRNCLASDTSGTCQVVLGTPVVFIGEAAFLSGARPDVEAVFPGQPQAHRAGWGFLILTNMLPHVPTGAAYGGQGPMSLYAVATDIEGNQVLLGRDRTDNTPTRVSLNNDAIAKPFGAIDTPGQGATISGVFANFGWALTPDADQVAGTGDILIPTNGSTVTVFIDGVPVGQVSYNQCRGSVGNPVGSTAFCNDDVASIFGHPTPRPTFSPRTSNQTRFRNLDRGRSAIGAFSIDTRTMTNGLHTIAWSVTDTAGRTEGIGSRFFNVLNSGTQRVENPASRQVLTRARQSLAAGLTPAEGGVWARTGFDVSASWQELHQPPAGTRHIRINELDRLELWLGADTDAGFLQVDGQFRDLPSGSHLNGSRFTWMPGAGFLGDYRLVFVRGTERLEVIVTISGGT